MTTREEPTFDVFLSHASEDKPAVRQFARHLKDAGLRVWLDEERLPPGFDAKRAILRGIDESRHVVAWITQHWQKRWTEWEIQVFDDARARGCRIIAVLHVELDTRGLGPYLAGAVKVDPTVTAAERLWLVHCGVQDQPPEERALWNERGAGLVPSLRVDADRAQQIELLCEHIGGGSDDAALRVELTALEGEARAAAEFFAGRGPRPPGYRVRLDTATDAGVADDRFREAVKAVLQLREYRVVDLDLQEPPPGSLQALYAVKDGDFEPEVLVFHAVRGLITEEHLTALVAATPAIPSLRAHHLVTNSYIAPRAREAARGRGVQLHSYEALLDRVLRLRPYLQTWLREYRSDDPVYKTYIGVKYLRRGEGTFATGRATASEFLIAESSEGGGFQVKGELDAFIDAWSAADGGGQVCLLGDYGTGKTSFMRHYFERAAQAYLDDPDKRRIPLLVNLANYSKSASIEQLMTHYLVNECQFRGDFRTFLKLAEMGKLLILLDGFDEMARQVDTAVRRHNFREIARLLVGDNKVVLSGRSNYFLTHTEVDEILGQAARARDPYEVAQRTLHRWPRYQIIEAALFDRWQIRDYLKKQSEWLASVGVADWQDLERTIKRTYNLDELARTPVLLEIMTKTLPHVRSQVADLNAARLYEMYTGQWLDREYDKGEIRHLVNRGDKELFVLDLAWHMLARDTGSHEVHFKEISERVRQHFNLERATEIEHFASDIRFCSFLVHAEHAGTYKFIHKSFMEYFAARRIQRSLFVEQDPSGLAGVQKLPDEVFFFLCQMVDAKEAEDLVALTRRTADGEARDALKSLAAELLSGACKMELSRNRLEAAAPWIALAITYYGEFQVSALEYRILHLQGELHRRGGRHVEAAVCFEAAHAMARADGDDRRVADSLLRIGEMHLAAGMIDEADRGLREARALFDRLGDGAGAAQATLHAGRVATAALRIRQAIQLSDEACQVYSRIRDRSGQVRALRAMAEDLSILGRLREALDKLGQAMAMNAEMGDDEDWTICLQHGDLLRRAGWLSDATLAYKRALALAHVQADPRGEVQVLHALGTAALSAMASGAARQYLSEALSGARGLGDRRAEASILLSIGDLEARESGLPRAVELGGESAAIYESMVEGDGIADVYHHIGRWLAGTGRFAEALEAYRTALVRRRAGRSVLAADVHLSIGKVFNASNDPDAAESALQSAREIYQAFDIGLGLLATDHALCSVLRARGDREGAQSGYQTVIEAAESTGALALCIKSLVALGQLRAQAGDATAALSHLTRAQELAKQLGLPIPPHVEASLLRLRPMSGLRFQVGHPAQPVFGRERELTRLVSAVNGGQGVLLVGDRRMGKTTLLWALANQLRRPDIPVAIDLAAAAGAGDIGIINFLVRRVVDKLESTLNAQMERPELTSAGELEPALRAIVEQAVLISPASRLVLILDELDQILGQSMGVEQAIRAVVQGIPNSVVVVAASTYRALERSRRSIGSTLIDTFVHVELGPWDPNETAQFITEILASAGMEISYPALERLVRLSGGIPLYVQLLGYYVSEWIKDHGLSEIQLEDIEHISISPDLRMSVESYLAALSEPESSALVAITSGKVPEASARSVMEKLLRRQLVIAEDGRLRPTLGLLEVWAQKQSPT